MKISRRIEMRTFTKVLEFASANGPQKKTNMATNCKMSYTRFIPLLNLMMLFGFLELDPALEVITITQLGKEVLERLTLN